MSFSNRSRQLAAGILAALLTACGTDPTTAPATGDGLNVMASNSIVGDVVAQIGGDEITLTVLMQRGQDPHSYEPSAADIARISEADILFANGLGFEEWIDASSSAFEDTPLAYVSNGVPAIQGEAGADPHVWTDPINVIFWANNIADALSELDPQNEETYRANAYAYISQLEQLDQDIQTQVAEIPLDQRKLLTNHDTMHYFANRYGFEIVGTILQGASEASEPSAGQIATLVETINTEDVAAIFMETTIGTALAETISEEVGRPVQLLTLHTDSLDAPGTPADSYIGMMRDNVATIVQGLAGE